MADVPRCPICGAALPRDATAGPCPRCRADAGATGAPTAEAAAAPMPASDAATGQWTDPVDGDTRPAPDGLPRGAIVRYFGDYEIRQELGRGGMGVVYQARQVSLNRLVALKMLRAGLLAGDEELRRFRNEAEAVALLDHPGIVPVYEVGAHDGQHYFSMKLVEGGSLVPLLERYAGDPRAAARLMAEAALAVHHAHMRGILHRDLKPANVLVDAQGHPHVTDFGLAKRVEADGELTQSGAILGTPAYMSPEQASGRRGTMTTATDVYGLGAILYALLAGRAPFGGDSVVETLDAVRTRPPEPPTHLNARVPRDLETICLKCLDKDPRRRYASAHELSADLGHWLAARPIAARRVGAAERAWLWCRRRPAVAALSGAVLLALVGGAGAVVAVQSRANAKLAAANTRLKTSNTALAAERERAVVRERQAVEAIRRFGDAIANEPALKNTPELEALRRRLLGEPIAFFRSLRDQLQADAKTRPESLERLAAAAYQHGHLSQTIGDRDDARASFAEGLAILERLVGDQPGNSDFRAKLARTHYGMAYVQASVGQPAEARASLGRASTLFDDLRRREPDQPEHRRGLARCRLALGVLDLQAGRPEPALARLREARDEFARLLPLSSEPDSLRAELMMCHLDIGGVEEAMGQYADALADYRRALDVAGVLVRANPSVAEYRLEQARIQGNIGKTQMLTGKPAEAEAALETARSLYEALAAEYPSTTDYPSALASCYLSLGQVAAVTGRLADSEARLAKARAVLERLAAEHPESPDFASELGATIHNLGEMQFHARQFAQARTLLREALGWQRKAFASNPGNPRYRECMDAHLAVLLQTAQALGDEKTVAEARRELAQVAATDPRLKALDARLDHVARREPPRDDTERLALARRAYDTRRHATAAHLWSDALANDPKLADDRQAQHRYNAACAAALAARGEGSDAPPPDDGARSELRRQALGWLRDELAAWSKLSEGAGASQRAAIAEALRHWRRDPDLAGVRDAAALAGLPAEEQADWRALWADVDRVLVTIAND